MSSTCSRTCSGCPGRMVCRCLKITEEAVLHAITVLGLRTVKDIRKVTGAGDGCTCCHKLLQKYIDEHSQPVGVASLNLPTLAAV